VPVSTHGSLRDSAAKIIDGMRRSDEEMIDRPAG
jgi:hypothetical protein